MFSYPGRGIPLIQTYMFAVGWTNNSKAYHKSYRTHYKKRVCWLTSRGRSVTRLTGLTRCQFRSLALGGWCHGLQRASW
jgi:ribosomal protein S14